MRLRRIKVQPDRREGVIDQGLKLGGWFAGKQTYLWIGIGARCIGVLSHHKLYRLAKAIVRQFEEDK